MATEAEEMGKIVTQLTITNYADQIVAARGYIPADQVRSATLDNVLVDTGAMTLCLPEDVVAQLGLDLLREVPIASATGVGTARVFQGARISLLGREGTFECLELPKGTSPLLGVIPLEALGIELDLRQQRLRLLPEEPGNTYWTVL
jgi:clan AA aspartic protease